MKKKLNSGDDSAGRKMQRNGSRMKVDQGVNQNLHGFYGLGKKAIKDEGCWKYVCFFNNSVGFPVVLNPFESLS